MNRQNSSKISIALCLLLVLILVVVGRQSLSEIVQANPFFNALILCVLGAGILHAIRCVSMTAREARWLNGIHSETYRAPRAYKPRLLAPVARWLQEAAPSRKTLSPVVRQTLLDAVSFRLEEQRDLLRYLSGLAIFLGLLGTFWGLLVTIEAVTDIIGALNVGGDALSMFAELKKEIRVPLGGMATSFSTSLFGLASSLVVGFLDLQVGKAQSSLYVDLEVFLTETTRMHGVVTREQDPSMPAYIEALLEKASEGLERMQRSLQDTEADKRELREQIRELRLQVSRLADIVASDVNEREAVGVTLTGLRRDLDPLHALSRDGVNLSEEFRAEFRMMTRALLRVLDAREEGGSPR